MAKRKPKQKSPPHSWAPWFYSQSGALKRSVRLQSARWSGFLNDQLAIYDAALGGVRPNAQTRR